MGIGRTRSIPPDIFIISMLKDGWFKIEFYYVGWDERHMLNFVRELPGRLFKWKTEHPYWCCPATAEVLRRIKTFRPLSEISAEAEELYGEKRVAEALPEIDNLDPRLLPYQKEGVRFIEKNEGHCLLADEMGLGKTVQALAWLERHQEMRPAIIVCPATLKLNWERECNKWMDEPAVMILNGRTKSVHKLKRRMIYILNYDILGAWLESIRILAPRVVISDEVQMLKNPKTNRGKSMLMLMKGNHKRFLALTGTPIVNRPAEFWTTLHILDPEQFPKYHTFGVRYCAGHHGPFGWNYNGVSRAEELHGLVFGRLAIRRRKEEVLKELPPKRRVMVPMKIDNQGEYDKAKRDVVRWITDTKGYEAGAKAAKIEALARLNALKQLTAKGKLASVKEWIENFLESEEKLVAFTTHHAIIDELFEHFERVAVKIDGRTSQKDRDRAVQSFQNDAKVKLLLGNIRAVGVGLTLTAASNTAFIELGWSPGEHSQAESRVDRIGQKASSVTAWYLIASGTIEEWIAKLIDSKQKVLDQVLEGQETEDEDLLGSLIEQLKGEE